MPEPITTVGFGALAAYLSKDGIQKLLGPTADYLGGGLRDFTQKRVENVGRIFQNASQKAGADIDDNKAVPPKVLKQIVDDGSFSDQPLEVEYLGGVLASSRTGISRDNRGAVIAQLVSGLSNYQLRAHYLIYSSLKNLLAGSNPDLSQNGRRANRIFLPFTGFINAMEFSLEEIAQIQSIFSHMFFGLYQRDLIESDFAYGQPADLASTLPNAPDGGIICQPSMLGFEVFLWAFGEGKQAAAYIFEDEFKPVTEGVPMGVAGAALLRSLGAA